jgi:glycosyltransferase involved in cell wall biosynthesis
MEILFWITVGVGGLWVLIFISNVIEFRRTPRLVPRPVKDLERLPSVTILVPARNEEANIRKCLRSLMELLLPDLEILVIDDRSTDATANIVLRLARLDPRIKLVQQIAEPPPGWMGKCFALHQAVRLANPRGEWLLFTDADTVHHPQSLSVSLREALDHQADLFSLIPQLEARNFWERLLQPTVAAMIAMFNRPTRINDPHRPDAFANGQYILMRRAAYDAVGGHEAVAGRVLEDVELARKVKALGHWTRLAVGLDLFQTRMYPRFGQLIQGWTKNLYLLLHSSLRRALLATAAVLVFSLFPTVVGLGALGGLALGWHPLPPPEMAWMAAVFGLVLAFQALLRAINRWYPAMALLAPLANLVALYILWRSAWLHRKGRSVIWKGRRVLDDRQED